MCRFMPMLMGTQPKYTGELQIQSPVDRPVVLLRCIPISTSPIRFLEHNTGDVLKPAPLLRIKPYPH